MVQVQMENYPDIGTLLQTDQEYLQEIEFGATAETFG